MTADAEVARLRDQAQLLRERAAQLQCAQRRHTITAILWCNASKFIMQTLLYTHQGQVHADKYFSMLIVMVCVTAQWSGHDWSKQPLNLSSRPAATPASFTRHIQCTMRAHSSIAEQSTC